MAERGEILNKGLLQRLARRLNIGAVGQFPPKLNLDEVLVVAGLDGPYSDYTMLEANAINNLVGVNVFTGLIAGEASKTSPTVPTVDTEGRECRVIAAGFEIDFDAAGATAFNGEILQLFMSLINPVTGGAFPVLRSRCAVATGILEYFLNVTGGGSNSSIATHIGGPVSTFNGWLPAGYSLTCQVNTDGTNFPANTTITKWALLAAVDRNQQPPGL